MPVPDFQSFFKPLLDIASDGKEHSLKEAREIIAQTMQLSEEDLAVLEELLIFAGEKVVINDRN